MEHYLAKIDEGTRNIISSCFPEYIGKKVKISTDIPNTLESYWVEGSKNFFVFYKLSNGKAAEVHSNHPFFESNQPNKLKILPPGYLIVMHHIFCGKDMGITIYANQEDITPMIPQNTENTLTREEKIVLIATRSFKNSYAGISDNRFREARRVTGIKKEDWEKAKTNLLKKGYLDKKGAITAGGKNIIGWKQLHQI